MARITQSKNNKANLVEDECVILLNKLRPYWKKQDWDEFPLLGHDIYKWSKENKCRYLRTWHLEEDSTKFERAIVFKNAKLANQFKRKWLEPLLYIIDGYYEFSNDKYTWNPVRYLEDYSDATKWFKQNNINIKCIGTNWVVFDSTKDLLLFKMRWM